MKKVFLTLLVVLFYIPCYAGEPIDTTYRIFAKRGADTAARFGITINTVGDINNDGCDDIAVVSNIPDGTSIYYGGSPPDTIADVFLQGRYGPPAAIDITGDGINEIIITRTFEVGFVTQGVIYFYRGYEDSVGTIPYDSLFSVTNNYGFGSGFICAYVDSDSVGDMLTATTPSTPGGATVYYYGGCITIDTIADWSFQIYDNSHIVVYYGFIDYDGDSQLDIYLVLFARQADFSYIYIFKGPNFADTPDVIIGYPLEIYPGIIDSTQFGKNGAYNIGDFDGDGWDDLGVMYADNYIVYKFGPSADTIYDYWLEGSGRGLYAIGDINFDGGDDIGTTSNMHGEYGGVDIYLGGAEFDLAFDGFLDDNVLPLWGLDQIGVNITKAGDFNCDGIDDFMFNAENFTPDEQPRSFFVYKGSPNIILDVPYEYEPSLPNSFSLKQNYPNPFNNSTNISFEIPHKEKVSLMIYNILGKEVKDLINKELTAGMYRLTWDGTNNNGHDVSSGVYLYKLSSPSFTQEMKMVLVK